MQSVLSLLGNEFVRDAVIIAAGYTIGRVGLPTLYQDIKHFIQGVVGAVKGAKAAVTSSTTTKTS